MNGQLKQIDIHLVKPPKNILKKHSKKQIEQIANSIKNFTQYKPIVIQKSSMSIINGYATFLALKKLKAKTIMAFIIDVDDQTSQNIQFIDNYTNQSSLWNKDKLQELFMDIPNEQISYTGFSIQEIENIFNDEIQNEDDKFLSTENNDDILENYQNQKKSEEIIFKKVYYCQCCNSYYDIDTGEKIEFNDMKQE